MGHPLTFCIRLPFIWISGVDLANPTSNTESRQIDKPTEHETQVDTKKATMALPTTPERRLTTIELIGTTIQSESIGS